MNFRRSKELKKALIKKRTQEECDEMAILWEKRTKLKKALDGIDSSLKEASKKSSQDPIQDTLWDKPSSQIGASSYQ